MHLTDIRKLFVQRTGRYDLVHDSDAYEDNGANELIRGALRYLNGHVFSPTVEDRREQTLTAGAVSIEVEEARVVHMVSYATDDEDSGWLTLDKIDGTELANRYAEADAGDSPSHWAVRGVTTTETDTYERRYTDYFDPPLTYTSRVKVYLGPPCTGDITLAIDGTFEELLAREHSQCWWSIKHPLVLVAATALWAEVFNRNREGMADFVTAIEIMTADITKDMVDQTTSENLQMGDSWGMI